MKLRRVLSTALIGALFGGGVWAQDPSHSGKTPSYGGLQARKIKSLSEQDIAEIRQGAGWGLALPAELNGRPGPAHLLELAEEIGLSAEQVEAIKSVHEEMRAEAITAGERFIAAEAALSDAFTSGELTDDRLRNLVATAAEARAALRLVHLLRHLSTPALLTEQQIQKYNVLRGYADDPCISVPEGHNPTMWRRHNGCD